jgi:alkyl hydroperoxide reductase subunit AhpC
LKQFEAKGAQIIGLSCDPVPALKVWAQSMGGIGYPLVSDFYPHGKVSQDLGIFNKDAGFTVRAVCLIDPQGVLRASHTYAPGVLPLADEVLKELTGLQGG